MATEDGHDNGLLDTAAIRAFESLPAGVLVFDARGTVRYATARARACLEIDGNEATVLPRMLPGIFARSNPADYLADGVDPIVVELGTEETLIRCVEFEIAPFDTDRGLHTAVVRDISTRRQQELVRDILYHIAESGHRTTNLEGFMAVIDRALSRVIDTSNFFIALIDRERNMLTFPYLRDVSELRPQEIPQERLRKTLTAHVLRTGRPLLIDTAGIMKMHEAGQIEIVGEVPRVWIGAPLKTENDVIGIICVQSYDDDAAFESEDLNLLTFVSNQIGNALWRHSAEQELRRYTSEVEAARDRIETLHGELHEQHSALSQAHRKLQDDLAIAARLQRSRLPGEPPRMDGIQFAWHFESCEEVAGDMFNVIRFEPGRLGVYVLDVSGHGVPAAFLSMTLSRLLSNYNDGAGILRARPEVAGDSSIAPPALVSERLNRRFPMGLDVSQFFTMIYGIVDVDSRTFTFARAGHHTPYVVRENGVEQCEELVGPAIGINPMPEFEEMRVQLAPGDSIVLTTDGVHEARNTQGHMFGEERVCRALQSATSRQAGDLLTALRSAVEAWHEGHPPEDDITIMAFTLT